MQIAAKSKIAKIISGILATISIAVIARIIVPVIWFWIGFEVLAALLVAVGCAGEWYLHHHPSGRKKKEKDEHHKIESRFIAAVVIGVFMEFLALAHAIPAAVQLEKDVVEIGTTNGWLVASNLVVEGRVEELRKSNDALEAKLKEKIITPKQIEDFKFLTMLIPKIRIRIETKGEDGYSYGLQIRYMLDEAGFYPPDSDTNFYEGVVVNRDAWVINPIGNTKENKDMILWCYDTNATYNKTVDFTYTKAGRKIPTTGSTNPEKCYFTIAEVFKEIGISIGWADSTNYVTPGNCIFEVSPKVF
jgi:hypothetical protein